MRMNAIRRLVVAAVAVPVTVWLLRKAGQSMQARHHPRLGHGLQKAASELDAVTHRRR